MPDAEATRCHSCGETHTDWEKDGQHAVNSGSHQGIIERWECGRCGAITEVGRR